MNGTRICGLTGQHIVEVVQPNSKAGYSEMHVEQLIQPMVGLTQQTGLTWDQAIGQRAQEVQTGLAANW
jgi:hypothetical protein